MSPRRTPSVRPLTPAATCQRNRKDKSRPGYAVLQLEKLENILAPNLFSLAAGIVPALTTLASAGVTALENYAADTLAVDYGPTLTVGPAADDAPAVVDASLAAEPDAATEHAPAAEVLSMTPAVVEDSAPATPAPVAADATAIDSIFADPSNLAGLDAHLSGDFALPNAVSAAANPVAQTAGATAGWSGAATGELAAPFLDAASLPAFAPQANVPVVPLQAAEASAAHDAPAPTNGQAAAAPAPVPAPSDPNAVMEALAQQGLRFEANRGQIDPSYNFVAHSSAFDIALNSTNAVLALKPSSSDADPVMLDMQLVGGNGAAATTNGQELAGVTNYYGGPGNTYTGVVSYAQVGFHDVYAGVDVNYYTNPGTHQLEYAFVVAPNADAGQVTLAFQGADNVSLDAQGDLVLHTAAGDVVQQAPVAYQTIDGVQSTVASRFTLDADNQVHFALGSYDHSRALTIDPTYVYSSYLGGAGTDQANGVAVNSAVQNGMGLVPGQNGAKLAAAQKGTEFVYVVGSTTSATFRPNDPNNAAPLTPTVYPANGSIANAAFLIAIDPTNNNAPLYFDYFGGNNQQVATAVAVDSANNAYVTGWTTSTQGFAVTQGGGGTIKGQQLQIGGQNGDTDAFVFFVNSRGVQTYGSYLGGASDDLGYGIAQDNNGNVYIVGESSSNGFVGHLPDAAFGAGVPGQTDEGFAAQMTVANGALASLTYLGGTADNQLNAVAAGQGGNVYVAGSTNSTDYLKGVNAANAPFQSALAAAAGGGVASDAVVADLVYNAKQVPPTLTYDTYFGGDGTDTALGIAVDPVPGDVYVVGSTTSSVGPKGAGWGAGGANPVIIQPTVLGVTGGTDAWVAKFDNKGKPNGAAPYFVYIAGTAFDSATSVALAPNAGATPYLYVAGTTTSADNNVGQFPATQGAAKLQNFNLGNNNTNSDAFLARLDPNAKLNGNPNPAGSILALSYIGGSDNENGAAVAFDPWANNLGNAWVAGTTFSTNFRAANVAGLQQVAGGGNSDGFLVSVKP